MPTLYSTTLILLSILLIGCEQAEVATDASPQDESSAPNQIETPSEPEPEDPVEEETNAEPPVDTAPQQTFAISNKSPGEVQTNRALTSEVTIEFNLPIIENTLTTSAVTLHNAAQQMVMTNVIYDASANSITITPGAILLPDEEYTVTVSDTLMAENGESLNASWTFTTAPNIADTDQQTIDTCMTAEDMTMLAAVNTLRETEQYCSGTGTTQAATHHLRWHCDLKSAALAHSTDMANTNFFSHTGSDGSSAGDRITATGYRWRAWGENLAALAGGNHRDIQRALDGWMTSNSGHCEGIMNNNVTEFGHAMVESTTAQYDSYWTQAYATPR